MNPIPDYSRLLQAVRHLGIDPGDCLVELERGVEIDSAADYIPAPGGFFDLLPTGHIVRVLVHLAAGDHARCVDDPQRWHRYHVAPCPASVQPSRRDRSFKTRRSDGRFTYFLNDFYDQEYKPAHREAGRALVLCGHCRNKLWHLALVNEDGEPDLPALLDGQLARRLYPDPFRHDLDRVTGFAAEDWRAIARHAKSRSGGFCSRCGERFPVHHLHAHFEETPHLPATLGRLSVLCAGCHLMQRGHERLRQAPELVAFRRDHPEHPAFRR